MVCQTAFVVWFVCWYHCIHSLSYGTLYVFKDEVQNILRKDAIYVQHGISSQKPLPISILREKVSMELNEKYPISSVEVSLDKRKSYRFLYYEKNKKAGITFRRSLSTNKSM